MSTHRPKILRARRRRDWWSTRSAMPFVESWSFKVEGMGILSRYLHKQTNISSFRSGRHRWMLWAVPAL